MNSLGILIVLGLVFLGMFWVGIVKLRMENKQKQNENKKLIKHLKLYHTTYKLVKSIEEKSRICELVYRKYSGVRLEDIEDPNSKLFLRTVRDFHSVLGRLG